MTGHTPAAQAANTNPLSDEYVNAVIQQHGYQSPETVIARLNQWIGLHGGENGVTLLMYEAHKALVKLRASVADEDDQPTAPDDDAIAECWVNASDCDGIAYDGPSFERGYRAALAIAPVAGEAKPSDIDILGLAGQYIQPSPVDVAPQIVNFSRALLSRYAAPQASEAVRKQALAALESAQRFIRNGVEFGYVRMPDADTPDPAHHTPGLIEEAIRALSSQPEQS